MKRVVAGALLAVALVVLPAAAAWAHPLGNFTVNLFSGISVLTQEIRIRYVIDMAEIPTFQEMSAIDTDGDGEAAAEELSAWAHLTAGRVVEGFRVVVDGGARRPELRSASARLLPGQAGLDVLRFEGVFSVIAPSSGQVRYADDNFEDRIGWREIVVAAGDGISLGRSTAPARSVSRALTSYPGDMLSETLDVRRAAFSYGPGVGASTVSAPSTPGEVAGAGGFVGLVSTGDLSAVAVAASFVLSILFGALHALGPGHGKAIMAAYLVGSRAGGREAVWMGVAVAAMHTASVVALALVVVSARWLFPPERVYPWMGLLAGFLAVIIGARLLVARVSAWRKARDPDHVHEHAHGPLSRRSLVALGAAGGILPSPTALLVLVGAAALDRLAFGIVLILGFSLGLAAALLGVGLAAVRVRELASRRSWVRAARLVPVLSAAAIVGLGSLVALRGLTQL